MMERAKPVEEQTSAVQCVVCQCQKGCLYGVAVSRINFVTDGAPYDRPIVAGAWAGDRPG